MEFLAAGPPGLMADEKKLYIARKFHRAFLNVFGLYFTAFSINGHIRFFSDLDFTYVAMALSHTDT